MIKIALDVMGGDNAPLSNLKGAIDFIIENEDTMVILVGDDILINKYINSLSNKDTISKNIEILHSTQIVDDNDKPSRITKTKPDSSMVLSIDLLKQKNVNAIVSAGNTGCLLASSLFTIGKINGIKRPALAALIPSENGDFLICDVGANSTIRSEHLVQFGVMSSAYMKHLKNINRPKIGLLNIGKEENKGNDLTISSYPLLKKYLENFIGNIESRYIFDGLCDIVLTDGFTGNIVLKLIEGVTDYNLKLIESMLGDKNNLKSIERIKKSFDYEEYGAGPILGINGLVFKSHGSSSPKAIKNALFASKKAHMNNLLGSINTQLSNMFIS